ncbi:MAG TPA: DegV family protein [Nocardioides sp.]|jgi:DegV family protein with EDD domain|uniref:DegV family protein n=1 Tax=Nocardioides sp. TaxID=35761 RepID=UPI002E325FAE|nr:DegV family protein [Nocardioides sp.]HEX3930742.1 DegV family protein [Nocardioides sp.]
MSGRAVVVTDSTASLPPEVARARGIVVVPLQVVIGASVYDEGPQGATPEMVAEALKGFRPVSTSRPAPAHLAGVYATIAAQGASEILSVHLSAEMSGTYESALLAARESPVPVTVVDSRQVGIATGYCALSAVDVLDAGGDVAAAAQAARRRAELATTLFYVDTLEYLRRGGRIGAAAAILGGALSVKPLLRIDEGRVVNLDRVRTSARALSRMEDLVVETAGSRAVDLCVSHLANPDRAGALAGRLAERLAANLDGRDVWCGELGAVLGAHVGPGMVAVCLAPLLGGAPSAQE